MSPRDDEIARRTPILRSKEHASPSKEQASTGQSEPSTTGPTTTDGTRLRAYTRRQLMGEEPMTRIADLPVPLADQDRAHVPAIPADRTALRLSEPDVVGVIIGFERVFGSTSYNYAAIKTPHGWYVTGSAYGPPEPASWRQLLTWLDRGQQEPPEVWVATSWEKLTADEP